MSSARNTKLEGSRRERRQALARFFVEPAGVAQRRYEALRAYFAEGLSAVEAAKRFGYAPSTMVAIVRDFRPDEREFFVERRPGPRTAPAKQAARAQVLKLRARGHSVTEIAAALADSSTPLNRTGVWELLREEGVERLAPRPAHQRGVPLRDHPPRVRVLRWPQRLARERSAHAGLMLLVPGLVALDLPGAVRRARLPGTREVPALSSLLSLLALKAAGRARVSHVDDVCTDVGLATFAGLESLPKASCLGSYSWRLERSHSEALQAALAAAMVRTGQGQGRDFDLDFHAIMHFGEDVALETHYVPRRSQRTESVLTFFAHDGSTQNLVYSNAACTKADQAGQAIAFARHWEAATGERPELLVFDSKVTTGAGLAELHDAGLRFITLRARKPKLTAELEALPDSQWTKVTLDRKGRYAHPEIHEDEVAVRGCPTPLRQIAIRGLGHEHPTLILTNDRTMKPAKLIDRYAARMSIEQRLAEAIRSFHLDSLSSAVALNVDFDCTLTVWAGAAYDHLRRQLTGYHTATPETVWRRFISTAGHITIGPEEVVAELDSRTYSPVMRTAQLPVVEVPWWDGRRLRFQFR